MEGALSLSDLSVCALCLSLLGVPIRSRCREVGTLAAGGERLLLPFSNPLDHHPHDRFKIRTDQKDLGGVGPLCIHHIPNGVLVTHKQIVKLPLSATLHLYHHRGRSQPVLGQLQGVAIERRVSRLDSSLRSE